MITLNYFINNSNSYMHNMLSNYKWFFYNTYIPIKIVSNNT